MKVKMLTMMAGANVSAKPGDELDVDDVLGEALVNGKYAISLSQREIETSVIEAPENAMLISKNKRK